MIPGLALAFALLQPIYFEQQTALWGGQITRIWNHAGHGIEFCYWPARQTWIVTLGYRGVWLKGFRVW
jgi:hypothetical protein